MNQARHTTLRASGWHYDPVSDRYSAPHVPLDGTQKMYTPAEAWEAEETARKAAKASSAPKDAPTP
jgi:hypothetical protein